MKARPLDRQELISALGYPAPKSRSKLERAAKQAASIEQRMGRELYVHNLRGMR